MNERLREARWEMGLTQEQVSILLKIDRATFANYELGRTTPKFKTAFAIAKFYKKPLEYFFSPDNVLRQQKNEQTEVK